LVLIALPEWAGAYEATFGIGAGVGYESNIFQAGTAVPDAVYSLAPSLRLGHETQRLEATLDYRPVAELYNSNGSANGVDQIVSFTSDYQITQRTEVSLNERFGYVQNLQRLDQPDSPTEVEIGRAQTTQNRANAALRHALTPRTSVNFAVNHLYQDSTRDNFAPLATLIGIVDLSHALTRADNVGIGASYTYTSFGDESEDDLDLTARRSNSVNLYLAWSRDWDRKWRTSLRVGPAWVSSTRRLVLNGFSPSGTPLSTDLSLDSTNVTAFGAASITRYWRTGEATLNYQRSLSAVSTIGTDSTIDALFGHVNWDFADKWSLDGRAGWNQRVSLAAEQQGGAASTFSPKITQYSFFARVTRAISEQLGVGLTFRYLRQDATGVNSSRNSFDNYIVNVVARYQFEPLRP